MEESLMATLSISSDHLNRLIVKAREIILSIGPDSPNEEFILEMEIVISKLESGLNRLRSDLNNYFRLVNEPAVDEVSRISAVQLEAEENLCELQVRLRRSRTTTSSRDGALPMTGKLPKLSLPEFHGDILQWSQFWDQYQSLVDSRRLNDVDKFLYLSSALKGEAKKLIEGLGATNKNYGIAISTLKSRYGRVELVKDAHYSALSKIKSAESSTSSCRNVLNEIEKHLRVLSSLGEDTTHSYLRFLILEKFPEEIIYEIKKRTREDSVTEIRRELEALISAKEDAHRFTSQLEASTSGNYTTETLHVSENFKNLDSRQGRVDYRDSNNFNRRSPITTPKRQSLKRKLHHIDRDSRGRRSPAVPYKRRFQRSCIFCDGGHSSGLCQRYSTVRQRKIKLGKRCYKCLSTGHFQIDCPATRRCTSCGSAGHHRIICDRSSSETKRTNASRPQRRAIEDRKNKETTQPTVQCHVNDSTQHHMKERGVTVLQTAVTNLTGGGNCPKVRGRALLDSGSMRSYISQDLAKKLKLVTIEESRLTIFTFGSKEPQEVDSPRVCMRIVTRSGETIQVYANVVPMITHSVPYLGPDKELWNSKFDLADDGSLGDRVDLLIGNDYYFSILLSEKIEIQENLFMVNSKLGWIISGRTDSKPVNELEVITYFQSSLEVGLIQPDLPLNEVNLKELWELETIGIVDSPKESREEEAVRNFNKTTRFENGRYQVSWPWIDYPPDLQPNFGLALGRLASLMKRLEAETLSSYDQLIKEQQDLGIIEIVPDEEVDTASYPVHYLPHHNVQQKGKPIRIVYDASSKLKDNKSLNQCLYCGPLMLEELTGILLKFRSHRIGICADVEKAFLQIGLQAKDRDVTRFLWIKNLKKPVDTNNILHMRFTRVPFGVISSPFLLNATIKYHLSKSNLEIVQRLVQDIYVDNMVTGTDTVEEAVDLYNEAKQEFQQMSMNLREWSSNSREFLRQIPDSCPDNVVKVLGLDWNLETDTLYLRVKDREYAKTKRGILRCIASVYDPCGYVAPSLLAAKLLLQDLWKLKMKWDCPLSGDLADRWRDVQIELKTLKETCVPRCCVENLRDKSYSIHCFTDASTKAYASVVYIVQGNRRSFVIGKSRLVPVKDQDDLKIPKLELIASLIGHRLIQYVKKFLQGDIAEQILWTDSQVVIGWYYSDKLLTPFVSRRIQEMKKNKDLKVRYVPTNINPADVATRPAQPREEVEKWLAGPKFLSEHPTKWPVSPPSNSSLLAGEGLSSTPIDEDLIDRGKQDEAATATSNIGSKEVTQGDIGIVYTKVSEIKEIQAKHFPEELAGKETSLKRNLGLFIDEDGILRSKGRFQYANWTYDKRYPILIPYNSPYTDEIIMKTHTDNYHVGATHTLSIIRQNFWIPQGRKRVLSVISKCAQCVKQRGGPFKLPPTPALPPERVNYTDPYTFTGIDFLGPILVNTKSGTEKRWICLFTCLAVRAVHLEVVRDLTAEEGLLALRRFIATRNIPTVITSDNATNLKLMSEVMTQPYCLNKGIKWRFIPQLAPWFGGFYERLVGMVKVCMRTTLQKHLLTDNQLITVIKEIEAVINSRPLTYVDEEMDHILRPSDFIAMGRTIAIDVRSDGPLPEGTQVKNDLVKSWKKGIVVLDEFKRMFVDRYLLSLRERYSHSHKQPRSTSKVEPSVGQVVQIKGDTKNREDWKLGKIVSLKEGKDNMCRVAQVQVGNKEYTRSLAQLYPLEIEDAASGGAGSPPRNKENSRGTLEDSQDLDIDLDADAIGVPPFLTNGEQESFNHTESIHEEITPEGATSPNNIDTDDDDAEDTIGASPRPRQPRDAAVRAREKIWQWTRSLMSLLSVVGSVANAGHRDDV